MAQEKNSSALATREVLIGVDLGSNYIRTGLIDPTGGLLDFHREPQSEASISDGRALADQLRAAVERMIKTHSDSVRITAIGVGFPGLVHHTSQQIINLPHAPSLANIDLHHEFEHTFGVPTYFENNANAAAYAEMKYGVAQNENDWIYLHIGSGIGAGLVLDGKLRRGKSGFAGEIGHVTIDPEGIACACGSIGCLETVASAPNVVRRTSERLQRDATSSLSELATMGGFTYDDIICAAQNNDDLAKMMLQRTGHFIGRAIAGVINLLNLSMVAIGGASEARPFLVLATTEEARRRTFTAAFEDCQIVAAKLGPEASVIGAALLAQ